MCEIKCYTCGDLLEVYDDDTIDCGAKGHVDVTCMCDYYFKRELKVESREYELGELYNV